MFQDWLRFYLFVAMYSIHSKLSCYAGKVCFWCVPILIKYFSFLLFGFHNSNILLALSKIMYCCHRSPLIKLKRKVVNLFQHINHIPHSLIFSTTINNNWFFMASDSMKNSANIIIKTSPYWTPLHSAIN